MPTTELTLKASANMATTLEEFFLEHGACAITYKDAEDQPILEPRPGEAPLWEQYFISGLFLETADIAHINNVITKQFPTLSKNLVSKTIQDQVWERAWLKDYQPIKINDNIWICPSDIQTPDPNAITITLDPGLAFGTGTHPTTHLCLEALANIDLNDKIVVDYGCGSGVLAITALKLGAKFAYAIDSEPQALIATQDNMTRNDINQSLIQTYLPENVPDMQPVEMVIANILSSTIIALSNELQKNIAPHGTLILSGLLDHQTADVIKAFSADFSFSLPHKKDGWVCLVGQKKT